MASKQAPLWRFQFFSETYKRESVSFSRSAEMSLGGRLKHIQKRNNEMKTRLSATFVMFLTANVWADTPRYTVTEIQPAGPYFRAVDMNDSGEVIGAGPLMVDENEHAFVFRNGTLTDLGLLPGATSSSPGSMNKRGQIVGFSGKEKEPYSGDYDPLRAFLYTRGGMLDLGTLNGGKFAYAEDINDQGTIVGAAYPDSQNCSQAFVYRRGAMLPVGTCATTLTAFFINNEGNIVGLAPGSATYPENYRTFFSKNGNSIVNIGCIGEPACSETTYAQPRGLSEKGHVTGYSRGYFTQGQPTKQTDHAFLWRKGVMQDLGTLGGGNSQGQAVNSSGEVVGVSELSTPDRALSAFLYDKKGVMRNLDPNKEWSLSFAETINDKGQIAGIAGIGRDYYGFIYTGGRIRKLDDLVSRRSPYKDIVRLEWALKISEKGQILVSGVNTQTQVQTAYILTPVDR